MKLYQYKDGFRYTSDTMFLYDFALKLGVKKNILDVGSGCGILGLLLAKEAKTLTLIEKNPKMAKLCEQNARQNDIDAIVINDDFLTHRFNGTFDYIVSNPPYYCSSVFKSENEDLKMARYAEAMVLDEWIIKAYRLLNPKGEIIFCYDSAKLGDIFLITSMLKPAASIANIKFVHSLQNKPSKLVLVQIKKDSKSKTVINAPLIVEKDANEIFARADCLSIDVD